MLEIQKLQIGPLGSCCYIITSVGSSEAMIIDPGGDAEQIIKLLEEKGLELTLLINTHGHGDHIGANKELKRVFPESKICIHQDDAEMLTDPFKNLSLLGGVRYSSPPADMILSHHDKVIFDGYIFEIIHLPGHTRGGIGIYVDRSVDGEVPVLFSGDTLFEGGIGRTNLPGGSHDLIVQSITRCIFTLNEKTIVNPGHGPSTTVEREKGRLCLSEKSL
ncbi:MAG: MBL fold metallo-hydrolase [Candidatus Scalindua sp. AMX11]|nr:MAG: MBL fold metallo-hydrolase [Candidatus Scalindua sp.]NOG83641.1 MBL fold metallo-hydrolase [Planctomycetota bacterium]RZV63228.1 MAG: MBL fold metallo-hydrolase [Candidatus Scalindua sp. SCAELEC01]TDE63407.1 MAG: MBL fold metallo-hydrolase [Candidatus Scalindua sp. AMX11]GJQ57336.1 MAG: MBL fold metallo-hydrolase [Candidatus Scalindua sp.]